MLIAITNQAGLTLKLSASQQLLLEQAAGWLSDDVLPGAKSYPIEFPIPPNEEFLQSGYRPDAARPVMEFPVTVRLTGVIYRRCLLNYRIIDGKGSGYLKIDGGEVFSQLKKLSLSDALPDVVYITIAFQDNFLQRMKTIAQMAPGQFPLTFFPVRNEAFFESDLTADKLAGFVKQPYVNAWAQLPNSSSYGFLKDTDTVTGYPVVPFFYLSWVLERLFAWAGYRVEGEWLADPEVQQFVILNQTAMSPQPVGLLSNTTLCVAGQHMPDMSVGDFLIDLRNNYGLLFEFDGNLQTVSIQSYNQIVRRPARDLCKYVVGNSYDIEPPANGGFLVREAVDSNDELYKDADGNTITPPAFAVGDQTAPEEITLPVCGTQMIYEPAPMGGNWTLPTMRVAGNILDGLYKDTDRFPEKKKVGETYPKLKNNIGLRIISYRGMQQSSNGSLYPLGTADVRDGRQVAISGVASRIGGRAGLWRRGLREVFYFKDQTRPVTVPVNLPVALVSSLKFSEPIALKLSSQARRTYLIDKLQAQSPGSSGIMESKLFALTVPDGLDLPAFTDEPLVWVSIVLGQRRAQQLPVGAAIDGTFPVWLQSVTVYCWANAAKTIPAVVTNLPVQIRTRRTQTLSTVPFTTPTSQEKITTYLVNGVSTVLEINLVQTENVYTSTPVKIETFERTVQIDPGDDYLIA